MVVELNYRTRIWGYRHEVDFIDNIGDWSCHGTACNKKRIKMLKGYIAALEYRPIKWKKRLKHRANLKIKSLLRN